MTEHLSEETLRRFRTGDLPFAEWKNADRHLAECTECRHRLLAIVGTPDGDTWWMLKQADAFDAAPCPDPVFWLAWIERRVSPGEFARGQSHLAECAVCRETVERFRAMQRAETPSRPYRTIWERIHRPVEVLFGRRVRLAWAVVLIVAVVALLYIQWWAAPEKPAMNTPAGSVHVFSVRDTSGTVTGSSDTLEIPGISSPPSEWITRIRSLLTQGDVSPLPWVARTLRRLQASVSVRSAEAERAAQGPRPIGPVATMVRHGPLTFHWKPVTGAERYYVVVADADLQTVVAELETGTRSTYTWEDAPRYLRPGHAYAWQIEAWTPEMVYISDWVRFAVLPEEAEHTVQRLEHTFRRSALALLTVYLTYGLYEDARQPLHTLERLNPDHPILQRIRQKLPGLSVSDGASRAAQPAP